MHGVGSDPPKNMAMLSGRGNGLPVFCHKAVSSLYSRQAEGKALVIFSSNEQGKCPVTFSSNEHGKMPECRECDGIRQCFWLIQTDFEVPVGILAPIKSCAPSCGGFAEIIGNCKSPHAMEQCLGNWAFAVPNMRACCSKVQPQKICVLCEADACIDYWDELECAMAVFGEQLIVLKNTTQ